MFFLKKLVSRFFFPVSASAGLLLLGLVLLTFTRRKRTGRALAWAGTLVLLLFAYPWLPQFILGRLESRHPPMTEAMKQDAVSRLPSVAASRQNAGPSPFRLAPSFIFVLGEGVSADTNRPPNARVSDTFLKRFTEGVRLRRAFTNATLLVSVSGEVVSPVDKWRLAGDLLAIYGLSTNRLGLCLDARDTEDEIRWCRQVAGTNQVLVVSCASHLPRAMALARRHALNAVPCPSAFAVDTVTQPPWSPTHLFPGAINLWNTERAANEYLGLAWERVRGAPNLSPSSEAESTGRSAPREGPRR